MTMQEFERIIINGEVTSLDSYPLAKYFEIAGIQPAFDEVSSSLWRGYLGTWEVRKDKLYLLQLHGRLMDGSEISVSTFFPQQKHAAFAFWFSGVLKIPQGKMIDSDQMSYCQFESDLLHSFENGILVDSTVQVNSLSTDPDAPDASLGSCPLAFTTFGRNVNSYRFIDKTVSRLLQTIVSGLLDQHFHPKEVVDEVVRMEVEYYRLLMLNLMHRLVQLDSNSKNESERWNREVDAWLHALPDGQNDRDGFEHQFKYHDLKMDEFDGEREKLFEAAAQYATMLFSVIRINTSIKHPKGENIETKAEAVDRLVRLFVGLGAFGFQDDDEEMRCHVMRNLLELGIW